MTGWNSRIEGLAIGIIGSFIAWRVSVYRSRPKIRIFGDSSGGTVKWNTESIIIRNDPRFFWTTVNRESVEIRGALLKDHKGRPASDSALIWQRDPKSQGTPVILTAGKTKTLHLFSKFRDEDYYFVANKFLDDGTPQINGSKYFDEERDFNLILIDSIERIHRFKIKVFFHNSHLYIRTRATLSDRWDYVRQAGHYLWYALFPNRL